MTEIKRVYKESTLGFNIFTFKVKLCRSEIELKPLKHQLILKLGPCQIKLLCYPMLTRSCDGASKSAIKLTLAFRCSVQEGAGEGRRWRHIRELRQAAAGSAAGTIWRANKP